MDTSTSAYLYQVSQAFANGIAGLVVIVASAFFGGFFAGWWTNHYESKRRISDKRRDKYYEHRNTIVQIEQELIPLRVNISRNLSALENAIENTNENNIRFILRFYELLFSTGLGLNLLSLDFINSYSQLYSDVQKFNSDIEYINGMVQSVREDQKAGRMDDTLIESYKVFLPYLKDECGNIDQKSLKLLAESKVAISKDDEKMRDKYVSDGKEIKYRINQNTLKEKFAEINQEEDFSSHPDEKRPRFVSPFLDLKRVIIKPI